MYEHIPSETELVDSILRRANYGPFKKTEKPFHSENLYTQIAATAPDGRQISLQQIWDGALCNCPESLKADILQAHARRHNSKFREDFRIADPRKILSMPVAKSYNSLAQKDDKPEQAPATVHAEYVPA
jgi:hypothetical protein